MKTEVLNQKDFPNTLLTKKFFNLNTFFVIDSPCIFCEKKIVRVQEKYDLIEFTDNGGIVLRNVKFRTAILKDDILEIVVYDTDSNQVLHRTHPFNDESVGCSWLLVDVCRQRIPDNWYPKVKRHFNILNWTK